MKFSCGTVFFALCAIATISRAIPLPFDEDALELLDRSFDGDEEFDLFERDETPSFDIEARDSELEARRGGAGAIGDAVELAIKIFGGLAKQAKQDKINRGKYTGDLVAEMRKAGPQWNFVVCHTKHKKAFDGKEGVDWKHTHKEFDVKIGGTIGYEVYQFKSGVFERQGDGGWLNWAYAGAVTKSENGGKKLTFAKP